MTRSPGRAPLVAAIAIALGGGSARADDHGFLHRLVGEVRARVADVIAGRAPKLVPPVPIALRWRPQRLGTLDLGAPIVALAAGDLDGDHRAELYAVTSREVIALALVGNRVKELGRVAFPAELATATPRDVVGSAIVDGGAVLASVSSRARGMRVSWRGRTLVGDPGEPGFALCAGERAELAPGRDYFGSGTAAYYTRRCRADLVDRDGHPLRVRAVVTIADKLEVTIDTCAADGTCKRSGRHDHAGAGVAIELADLDRDGRPEVIFAAAGAPGEPDEVTVVTLGDDDKKPFKKTWKSGVAAIVAADVDGDGAEEVIVAVRLLGSTRVDLWRLN